MKEKKQSMFKSLVFGNKLIIICVFFTIATMLDIILCTIFKTESATTHVHLIDRMLLSIVAVLPLIVFKHFEKLSMLAILSIYYVVCCGLAELYVFIAGKILYELHPDAYRDIFRSVTIMFLAIVVGALAIDLTRTAIANKELKKIQSKTQ